MTVLAIVEHDGGVPTAGSLQAVAVAAQVGGTGSAEAVAFGPGAELLRPRLVTAGVARLHVLEHDLLDDYSPETWGESLAQLVGQLRPDGVVAAGTDRGNELMAQAAARAGLPFAANCVAVDGGTGTSPAWQLTRARVGGLLYEDADLTASVKMLSLAAGVEVATAPSAADSHELPVEVFTPELPADFAYSRVVERAGHTTGVTLATAPVVVSGGRGVASAEGFAPLEELAELVGGAVGCSRVATNNGWRPHSDQVGQTGTRIAPDLYIACGISGATQHWVGCMNAKAILAINTDPEAPMVTRATYAVIGDVQDVLPAVIAAVRRRAGASTGRRPALT
ncbi:electron transfer flavoprotein alpha subunit apoprotein [Haloactinopolyspora alba]|uniref:Electron transfer flavoprotein alpha subunit apoprotein n=1 Tax=Haloactinopolyspora alba TaxID=648780 RepID=A0A2P8DIB1_9ACTN|nr:electron transfer flavoprotein subunit alpha/FixB family protein [Haloactinopolyspora alba]PSK96973.1 electron transfer flavoprotein alpha subunit apoprotein [Haloactinopolyspora alba]